IVGSCDLGRRGEHTRVDRTGGSGAVLVQGRRSRSHLARCLTVVNGGWGVRPSALRPPPTYRDDVDNREDYVPVRALVTGVPLMLVAGTLVCGVVGVRELMVGVMASGILLLALASFLLMTAVVVAAWP